MTIRADSAVLSQEAHAAHFEDLKKRYGGKIDATVTGPAAKEHRLRFERLMREWNPMNAYGNHKEVAGKPTWERKGLLVYTFDDGETVVQWILAGNSSMKRVGPFTGPDRLKNLHGVEVKTQPGRAGGWRCVTMRRGWLLPAG